MGSDAVASFLVGLVVEVECGTFGVFEEKGLRRLLGSEAALAIALGAYDAVFAAARGSLGGPEISRLAAALGAPEAAVAEALHRECRALRGGLDLAGLPAGSRGDYLAGVRKRARGPAEAAAGRFIASLGAPARSAGRGPGTREGPAGKPPNPAAAPRGARPAGHAAGPTAPKPRAPARTGRDGPI